MRPFILLLCSIFVFPLRADDLRTRIRDLVSRYDALGRLSGTVLVARGGEVLWISSHGDAVREHRVPNSRDTRYAIASMTKPVTAAAVLALVADGRIELDAPLARYLPQHPKEQAERVTIRQLLAHTSGIPSVGRRGDGLEEIEMKTPTTLDAAIALSSSRALLADPGAKYRYSNTGYMLLAKVVETVAGMPFDRFLTERIFRPAGMRETAPLDLRAVTPRLANGYVGYEPGLRHAETEHPSWGVGSGNLVSTVTDLHQFARALTNGTLLPKELTAVAFTPQSPEAGSPYRYGLGWFVYQLGGHRIANHGGTLEGFISSMFIAPDDGIFVTVLTNVMPRLGVDMADRIGEDLVKLVLGQDVALPPMPVRRPPAAETPARRTYDFGGGRLLRVSREGDALVATADGSVPWSLVDLPRLRSLEGAAAPRAAQAVRFADALRSGDAAALAAGMIDTWKKNVPAEQLVASWAKLVKEHGAYLAAAPAAYSRGRFHSVTLRIAFERRDVDMTVVLDDDGRYAGWWHGPSPAPRTVTLTPEAEGAWFVDAFPFDRDDVRVAFDGDTITAGGVAAPLAR